jgi:N-methylhydantoinase A
VDHLVAADTGGTFTDVAIYDPASGSIRFGKTLTTYGDLVEGVVTGLRDADGQPASMASLRHGTTHVINAFLQRKGARTALVATQGFRDVLELGRGNRPGPFRPEFPPHAATDPAFPLLRGAGADRH